MDFWTSAAYMAGGAAGAGTIYKIVLMFQEKAEKLKVSKSDWRGVKVCIEKLEEKTDKHDTSITEIRTEFKLRMEFIEKGFAKLELKIDEILTGLRGLNKEENKMDVVLGELKELKENKMGEVLKEIRELKGEKS